MVKRTGGKTSIPIDEIVPQINKTFKEIYDDLFTTADQLLHSRIRLCSDLDEVMDHVKSGIARIPWCGEQACGLDMEEIVGTGILGTPEDHALGKGNGACPVCGKPTDIIVLMARTY